MTPATPQSIKALHEQLHAELVRVSRDSGELGNAAKVVIRLLQRHFEREEAHVLPLLSLLPKLATQGAPIDLAGAEALAKGVRDEVRRLIQGHGFLAASLEDLVRAARMGDHAASPRSSRERRHALVTTVLHRLSPTDQRLALHESSSRA